MVVTLSSSAPLNFTQLNNSYITLLKAVLSWYALLPQARYKDDVFWHEKTKFLIPCEVRYSFFLNIFSKWDSHILNCKTQYFKSSKFPLVRVFFTLWGKWKRQSDRPLTFSVSFLCVEFSTTIHEIVRFAWWSLLHSLLFSAMWRLRPRLFWIYRQRVLWWRCDWF